MRKFRRIISLICFLPFVVGLPANAWGTVICHGNDGHIELELSVNGKCSEQSTKDSRESHGVETCECGTCDDYSFASSITRTDEVITSAVFLEYEKTITALENNFSTPLILINTHSSLVLPQGYSKPNHLRIIRSTILLI